MNEVYSITKSNFDHVLGFLSTPTLTANPNVKVFLQSANIPDGRVRVCGYEGTLQFDGSWQFVACEYGTGEIAENMTKHSVDNTADTLLLTDEV